MTPFLTLGFWAKNWKVLDQDLGVAERPAGQEFGLADRPVDQDFALAGPLFGLSGRLAGYFLQIAKHFLSKFGHRNHRTGGLPPKFWPAGRFAKPKTWSTAILANFSGVLKS